jgi:rRNA-processing protein FCF1
LSLIVFDTDFLIKISNDPLPKIDFKELSLNNEFAILPSVIREIKGLGRNLNPTTSKRAKTTERFLHDLKKFDFVLVREQKSDPNIDADEALIEFVKENPQQRILATLDGSLLSKFEELSLPYITLSKGRLLFHPGQRARYLTKRTA